MGTTLSQVEHTVRRGKTDYLLWQDISKCVRLVADLRSKEARRQVELEMSMGVETAMALFGSLQAIVRQAVIEGTDKPTAQAILRKIQSGVESLPIN